MHDHRSDAPVTARDLALVSIIAFVACVVVPPPQRAAATQQPPSVTQAQGSPYGGSTYGVNTCSNSYGGTTYGGATCGSWITDSVVPAELPGLGPNLIGIAVMQPAGAAPCRTPSLRDCAPAIGADVTLANITTGAPISAKTDPQGRLYVRAAPGQYKIHVDFLGTAVESTVTFDAATIAGGMATLGVSLSPNDRR